MTRQTQRGNVWGILLVLILGVLAAGCDGGDGGGGGGPEDPGPALQGECRRCDLTRNNCQAGFVCANQAGSLIPLCFHATVNRFCPIGGVSAAVNAFPHSDDFFNGLECGACGSDADCEDGMACTLFDDGVKRCGGEKTTCAHALPFDEAEQ